MKIAFSFFLLVFGLKALSQQDTTVVHFPFDEHYLTTQAKTNLDQFITEFKSKKAALTIKGHCDAKGSDAYNDVLSEKRVNAVKEYLLKNGIDPSVIVLSKGFGEREPLNENMSDEERQQNRRVEIIWPLEQTSRVQVEKTPQEVITLKEKIDTVKAGENIRLQNINFYGGRHTFLRQSIPALNELLQVMNDNPTLVVEIQGHICCFRGEEDGMDYDANEKKLSVNRARAVYNFLLDNGIDKKRLSYKGLAGTQRLVEEELTETDRTLNRRVEIKIISK